MLRNMNHPNIVKYKDHLKDDQNLYIVMGYCEGGDLHSKIKEVSKSMQDRGSMLGFETKMNVLSSGIAFRASLIKMSIIESGTWNLISPFWS